MTKKYDFSQLDALKRKVDSFRPFEAGLYRKLRHKLSIDWTYNSSAIEGNTLTLSETRFFLEVGLTSKGKPLSEYLEIKNHKHAIDYLEMIVREKTPMSERLIKDLHAMLFENNEDYQMENERGEKINKKIHPGKYKQENNYVLLPDGSRKYYMDPLKTVDAMQELIKFYDQEKDKVHPVVLAAELHARFVAIHPFVDGNGRVARLMMNLVLMQAGYEPAIIQNEFKQDYYESLRYYDEMGDLEPFISILEQEIIRTLQTTLRAVQGEAVFEASDVGKRLDTFTRKMEALDKDVGKFSKKVSDEEKKESIRHVRDYLKEIAKNQLEKFYSKLFNFEIVSPVRLENLKFNVSLELKRYLETKGFITDPISLKDFITEAEDGSAFCISLKTNRIYIPTSFCFFALIPDKYTLYICSAIDVSKLTDNKHLETVGDILINSIQNGILWEDWNKKDLEHFFIEVFNQYMLMIEEEAEKRRLKMEEKTDN